MLTIGIMGHNGRIGAALSALLVKAHQAARIKLVVLHRSSSDISKIPSGIEKRVIDLEGDVGSLRPAFSGINVMMWVFCLYEGELDLSDRRIRSAIATPKVLSQNRILEALVRSPDLITFLPSEYGLVWYTKEIEKYPKIGFLAMKDQVADKARELGVPVTIVHCGSITEVLLAVL